MVELWSMVRGAAQVAAEASIAIEQAKKAHGSGDQERAQPALWHCGNCRETGPNAQTCKRDIKIFSESERSTTDVDSLFDSDINKVP
jgi:hypothetical protein